MDAENLHICICGGGNMSHAFAALLSNAPGVSSVAVHTRRPNQWQGNLRMYPLEEHVDEVQISGRINASDSSNMLRKADVIILSLPCNVRYAYLNQIKKDILPNSVLLFSPSLGGIDLLAHKEFPQNPAIFCQRVPYISRILRYGESVSLSLKKTVACFFSPSRNMPKEKLFSLAERLLGIKVTELQSPWPLLLSNSNPIIHIARLCELVHLSPFANVPYFYRDWGDEASQRALNMDAELARIFSSLGTPFQSLEDYYEVSGVHALTEKFSSIPSLHQIKTAMIHPPTSPLWIPDTSDRYFREDIPMGTLFIKLAASLLSIDVPTINDSLTCLQRFMNEHYLREDASLNLPHWTKLLGFNPVNLMKERLQASLSLSERDMLSLNYNMLNYNILSRSA